MIPAEAVEAAAKALYTNARWVDLWDETHEERREHYRTCAKVSLGAAARYMYKAWIGAPDEPWLEDNRSPRA